MQITPPAFFKIRLREGIDRSLLVHDEALRDLYQKLLPLLEPGPESEKRKIGFAKEAGEVVEGGKREAGSCS